MMEERTDEGLVTHAPRVEVAAVLVADTVVALVAVATVGALAARLSRTSVVLHIVKSHIPQTWPATVQVCGVTAVACELASQISISLQQVP